jgi:hypothetical protein
MLGMVRELVLSFIEGVESLSLKRKRDSIKRKTVEVARLVSSIVLRLT